MDTKRLERAEEVGKRWQTYTMEMLVGYDESRGGIKKIPPDPPIAPGLEMQRRLIEALGRFSRTSTWLAGAMIFIGLVQIVVALLQ